MNLKQARKSTLPSTARTEQTQEPITKGNLVLPGDPFLGVDGNTYKVIYDPLLNTRGNCYAFAMGWTTTGHRECGDFFPGFLARKPFNIEEMEALVRADMDAVKRKVWDVKYAGDIPEELPHVEGSYWIKAFQGEEPNDFHFAMKEPKSGRWIHKLGWETAPKVLVRNTGYMTHKEQVMGTKALKDKDATMMSAFLDAFIPEGLRDSVIVTSNQVETNDAAGFEAWTEQNRLRYYKPLWVMRVSEP